MNLLIGAVKPHHTHYFLLKSSDAKGHYHVVKGITRVINGNRLDRHIHMFRGVTTLDNRHYHRFYGKTGPAIPLEGGGHYHVIDERTFYNYDEPLEAQFGGVIYGEHDRPKHEHRFSGKTIDIIGYDPFLKSFL